MSDRSELAARIAQFICDHNLANPFGGDVEQSKDKRHYGVLFSVPRLLDGYVQVFSPKFIVIACQGPLCQQQAVYESEANAMAFLRYAFVDHDMTSAFGVPTKPEKVK